MKRFQSFLLITSLFFGSQVVLAESSFAAKIDASHASSAMSAGSTTTFTFRLNAPIICQQGSPTCAVTLNFSNSNPSVASLDSNSISWSSNEWSEARTISLSISSSLSYTDNASVVLSSVASSYSVYYSNFAVSINQPLNLPPTPVQIAAAQAAAAAEAARIRQIEIDSFRSILFAKFLKGERPKLIDYNNAAFNQVTVRTIETVTDRVLLLDSGKRSDAVAIKAIADDVTFYDEFFNPLFRPTVATYVKNGYTGVSERTLIAVNAQVLALPLVKRADLNSIQAIASSEALTDRIANPATRKSVTATVLIANGLLPANSEYKSTVVSGLASYSESSLNTRSKIEAAIKDIVTKAQARKLRTEAIKNKIAARKK